MAIFGVKLTNSSKVGYVVSTLHQICCASGSDDNIAHLSGCEASKILPRQYVQDLPVRTAKILSEISRRGLIFHVAPHGKRQGIYIASNTKTLSKLP